MLLSVIIPSFHRNDLLASCLDCLHPNNQTWNVKNYEVIVTDDGNITNAKQLIKENYPWAKWMEGPKKGRAANRNNGAREAIGSWLIFIDDDCLPAKTLLEKYSDAIVENPDAIGFEGSIHPDDTDLLKRDMSDCPVNLMGGCFWSANICIKTAQFNSIGGFDEIFISYGQEDQDIYRRLLKLGNIPFLKDAIVVHPVSIKSFFNSLKNIPDSIINWYKYNRKYQGFFSTIITGCKSRFLAFISNIKRRKIKSAILNLSSLASFVPVIILRRLMK